LIGAGGRDTRLVMARTSIFARLACSACLACAIAVLLATAEARAAEESSSSEDSAPFAGGGGNKGPAPFAASPSAGFAAIGQWVLTMKTTDDGGYAFFRKASGGDWELNLHPSLDYFIINNVSLGATVGYSYSPAGTGITVFSLGARAGLNMTINDNLGFWPSAGVGFKVDSRDYNTNTTSFFGVFAPFLYHLVPHLFVGLGPSFSMQLDGDSKVFGIDFVLGGWL
jgi:hypothetical protein